MSYVVRPLALALICFVAIGAWAIRSEANGSADIRPLAAAEQRATWASQPCAQANLISRWVCDGALSASCSRTWIGTCCITCRDGCTRVLDNIVVPFGTGSWGYMTAISCGTPGLGMTYNVRNCNPFTCCSGTITGTFACNAATTTVWIICG